MKITCIFQLTLDYWLLISWHFISPKRVSYFNVDKEASASGIPYTRPLTLDPKYASQPLRQIEAYDSVYDLDIVSCGTVMTSALQ